MVGIPIPLPPEMVSTSASSVSNFDYPTVITLDYINISNVNNTSASIKNIGILQNCLDGIDFSKTVCKKSIYANHPSCTYDPVKNDIFSVRGASTRKQKMTHFASQRGHHVSHNINH